MQLADRRRTGPRAAGVFRRRSGCEAARSASSDVIGDVVRAGAGEFLDTFGVDGKRRRDGAEEGRRRSRRKVGFRPSQGDLEHAAFGGDPHDVFDKLPTRNRVGLPVAAQGCVYVRSRGRTRSRGSASVRSEAFRTPMYADPPVLEASQPPRGELQTLSPGLVRMVHQSRAHDVEEQPGRDCVRERGIHGLDLRRHDVDPKRPALSRFGCRPSGAPIRRNADQRRGAGKHSHARVTRTVVRGDTSPAPRLEGTA